MNRLHHVLGLAAVIGVAPLAHADFFNNATGLSTPQQIVTFETATVVPNDPVTNQFALFGVTFAGAFGDPDTTDYANISGHRIGNFQANVGSSPTFTIDFASSLGQVGFALASADGVATFEALLHGTVVDSALANTSAANPTNFYGFANIVFDQLRISVSSFDNAFLLDNLQTVAAPVPEPETWASMVAGLAALSYCARRRRRDGKRRP